MKIRLRPLELIASEEETKSELHTPNLQASPLSRVSSPPSISPYPQHLMEEECGNEYQQQLQQFQEDCSIGTPGYGLLEKEGIVANFKGNRFLKAEGEATGYSGSTISPAGASTRAAVMMGIDLTASANEEDKKVIRALTGNRDEITRFRTKTIKYGNHNAIWEIMAEKLYSLTGMESPHSVFMISENDPRTQEVPKLSVASPMITGYYDLGNFLIDDAMLRFIRPENNKKWRKLKSKVAEINEKWPIISGDKLERVRLLGQLYELLPSYFHQEIEKAFAASKFIHNWDFANFNLCNIGCRFTLNDEGKVISFQSVFVDFGNSGTIGFGGKYKELSFARANTEAKKWAPGSYDYDPSLELTPEEIQLLEEYKVRHDAAQHTVDTGYEQMLRESAFFKDAHHITEQESTMDIGPTTGFLTFSDLPRNIPFAILFKQPLAEKTKQAIAMGSAPTALPALYCDSEIEMAFRLSLIPDEAIDKVFEKWNLCERYPLLFPLPEGLSNPNKYRGEMLAQIFRNRKDVLINSIPRHVVNEWLIKNRAQAVAADQTVRLAILEQCGNSCQINEENSFTQRLKNFSPAQIHKISTGNTERKTRDFVIYKIKEEIEELEDRLDSTTPSSSSSEIARLKLIIRNMEREIRNISENQFLPEELKDSLLDTMGSSLEEHEKNLKRIIKEVEQQKTERVVKFIEDELPKWKKALGLDSMPNCNPLNLARIKKEFALLNEPIPDLPDGINSNQKNLERNEKVYMQNRFIILSFLKILDQISPPLSKKIATPLAISETPSPTIETYSINAFALADRGTVYRSATI